TPAAKRWAICAHVTPLGATYESTEGCLIGAVGIRKTVVPFRIAHSLQQQTSNGAWCLGGSVTIPERFVYKSRRAGENLFQALALAFLGMAAQLSDEREPAVRCKLREQ